MFINTTHANVDTRFQLHFFNALTKANAESAKQLYNFALFMIKSPYINIPIIIESLTGSSATKGIFV